MFGVVIGALLAQVLSAARIPIGQHGFPRHGGSGGIEDSPHQMQKIAGQRQRKKGRLRYHSTYERKQYEEEVLGICYPNDQFMKPNDQANGVRTILTARGVGGRGDGERSQRTIGLSAVVDTGNALAYGSMINLKTLNALGLSEDDLDKQGRTYARTADGRLGLKFLGRVPKKTIFIRFSQTGHWFELTPNVADTNHTKNCNLGIVFMRQYGLQVVANPDVDQYQLSHKDLGVKSPLVTTYNDPITNLRSYERRFNSQIFVRQIASRNYV